jgi:conserved oligomeric Golgi complex subunit 6
MPPSAPTLQRVSSTPTPASLSPLPTPTERSSPSSAARNPISLRLYKILGTNFQDPSTREALETLSGFYSPAVGDVFTSQKPRDDADLEDESGEERRVGMDLNEGFMAAALKSSGKIGDLPAGDIAETARKNFRRDTEMKLAEGSQKFLNAFGAVDKVRLILLLARLVGMFNFREIQKLDDLEEHIKKMRARCDETDARLQATSGACQYLLERASGLRTQRSCFAAALRIVVQGLNPLFPLMQAKLDNAAVHYLRFPRPFHSHRS